MYVHVQKYVDYDGQEKEVTLYFHMTKAHLAELRLTDDHWSDEYIDDLKSRVNEEKKKEKPDKAVLKEMLGVIKSFIRESYGRRTPNGGFEHTDELADEFVCTEAYSEFYLGVATNLEKQVQFVENLMSSTSDERAKIKESMEEALKSDE